VQKKDLFLLLLVTTLWGLSFTVMKLGMADMPSLCLAALRFFFTAFPAVFFIKKPNVSWGILGAFGVCLGVFAFGTLFAALEFGAGAGLSSIVMQTQVFFTILLSAILFKETILKSQIIGMLFCFAGLAILAFAQSQPAAFVPLLMVVGASLAWSVANIITKKAGNIDMFGFIVYSSLFSPLPLLALSFALDGQDAIIQGVASINISTVMAIVYLSLLATLLAFSLWSRMLQKYKAAVVTPFALMVPVSGIIGGTVFLNEHITLEEIAGGTLIFAGLFINVMGIKLRPLRIHKG
jgi:O-acetylserine/cysteine efflux transporter